MVFGQTARFWIQFIDILQQIIMLINVTKENGLLSHIGLLDDLCPCSLHLTTFNPDQKVKKANTLDLVIGAIRMAMKILSKCNYCFSISAFRKKVKKYFLFSVRISRFTPKLLNTQRQEC